MRKRVVFTVALLIGVSLLGFSGGQGESAGSTVTQTKIVAMLDVIISPEMGLEQWIDEYERITGIELVMIKPPHQQYYEKVQLAFSSGDMPDTVEIDSTHLQQYASDGALIELSGFIKNSGVMQKIGKEYLNATRFPDGRLYSVPYDSGGGTITYVRGDWLEKLGLDIPSTWDEFSAMLRAFKDGDLDGNGKDDTIPYVAPGVTSDIYIRDIYQDATAGFAIKDDMWVDGYAQPEFLEAMERLAMLYSDGLIDPEIFTNKTSTSRNKFWAGNTGVFNYWIGLWNVALEDGVQNGPAGPDAFITPIPAIEGSHYINRVPPQNAITIGAEDPGFVFKNFIEFMHDMDKGQMLFSHGVKDVHYKINADGSYEVLPRLDMPERLFGKAYVHPEWPINNWDDPIKPDQRVTDSVDMHRASSYQQKMTPPSETYLKVSGDLSALRDEIVSKIAIGDLTPGQGLDQYKREAEALGMQKILDEMNAM